MGRPETGRTGARFGAPARRSRHTPDPDAPHGQAPEETDAGPSDEAPAQELGLTGARFGGRVRRSRKERQAEKAAARADRSAQPADEVGGADDARPTVELPRITDEPAPAGEAALTAEPLTDEPALYGAGVAVRPYVLTGGRTKVRVELRIETLVSTLPPPAQPGQAETGERRTVLELCERPRSVSEVAALTRVPLGVARVLIDDLAGEGRLRVHLGVDAATGPDMELLDRVLSGLRRL